MRDFNIVAFGTDSYKHSHHALYPEGVETVYSYCEARKGGMFPEVTLFGLQYILARYLAWPVVTREKIEEAATICEAHFGRADVFNRKGWEHILNAHGGCLPIRIMALPEGTTVPEGTALFTIENTDPQVPWLTNYLETLISQVWSPTTVCTSSREIKKIIAKYLDLTGDPQGLPFKLHDFGYRGVSSRETAALAGAAHLVNFLGTDTLAAIPLLRDYYGAEDMAGFSIPATEHSVMTAGGPQGEADIVRRILATHPTGLVAMVGDSFDMYRFVTDVIGKNDDILAAIRQREGCVVIRPDCYDKDTEILTEDGWRFFFELQDDTKVAQYAPDGTVSFTKPIKRIEQWYDGEMYHVHDQQGRVDLCVTPNHRMVRKNKTTGEIDILEASEIHYNHRWSHEGAGYKTTGKQTLTPYERLLIAFQADGSFESSHKPRSDGRWAMRFNFKKKRKTKRLLEICREGGFDFRHTNELARPENDSIYVFVDHKPTKDLDDWVSITDVSDQWARQFIEELSYWDATRRTDCRFKYNTRVYDNVNVIQALCSIGGMITNYTLERGRIPEKHSPMHTVHIITNQSGSDTQKLTKEEIDYADYVYCVQVPTGMLIVRRNGAVSVSGNSGTLPGIDLDVFHAIESVFGSEANTKGFRVLPPYVRMIQGDGIEWQYLANSLDPTHDGRHFTVGGEYRHTVEDILEAFRRNGISADNIAFGSGGGLLQKFNRDTQRFAIKCSAMKINGEWRDIFKQPATDPSKNSKRGRLAVIDIGDGYETVRFEEIGTATNHLKTCFSNGTIYKQSFDDIRQRASLNEPANVQ